MVDCPYCKTKDKGFTRLVSCKHCDVIIDSHVVSDFKFNKAANSLYFKVKDVMDQVQLEQFVKSSREELNVLGVEL